MLERSQIALFQNGRDLVYVKSLKSLIEASQVPLLENILSHHSSFTCEYNEEYESDQLKRDSPTYVFTTSATWRTSRASNCSSKPARSNRLSYQPYRLTSLMRNCLPWVVGLCLAPYGAPRGGGTFVKSLHALIEASQAPFLLNVMLFGEYKC